MDPRRPKSVLAFLAIVGIAFYVASALWDVYFIPSVPMAADWCRDWVDLREEENPAAFAGCVEFKNDLEASKYYYNKRLIERNKWWFYGCILMGVLISCGVFWAARVRRSRDARDLTLALVYGFLVATIVPRVYSAVLPAPYKWFPAFLTQAALERQREAAILVGVPPREVDDLVESQIAE